MTAGRREERLEERYQDWHREKEKEEPWRKGSRQGSQGSQGKETEGRGRRRRWCRRRQWRRGWWRGLIFFLTAEWRRHCHYHLTHCTSLSQDDHFDSDADPIPTDDDGEDGDAGLDDEEEEDSVWVSKLNYENLTIKPTAKKKAIQHTQTAAKSKTVTWLFDRQWHSHRDLPLNFTFHGWLWLDVAFCKARGLDGAHWNPIELFLHHVISQCQSWCFFDSATWDYSASAVSHAIPALLQRCWQTCQPTSPWDQKLWQNLESSQACTCKESCPMAVWLMPQKNMVVNIMQPV